MGEIGTWISGIVDVGLAPILVFFLLWRGFDLAKQFLKEIYELRLAIQIVLDKLDATDEYNKAIRELERRE